MTITKQLKKGYTTGVHTSFAFRSALSTFLATNEPTTSKTIKMDNDDLDVTKGCEIVVFISKNKDDLELNKIAHKPYILKNITNSMEIYAGVGVGIVTKDGLKPPKNHPAINPAPLDAISKIYKNSNIKHKKLYCCISVIDGENLAKQTANAKVGVLGGISILGTTGFVKPISATAYIDSIAEELNYAKANHYAKITFTLGNTAYKKALELNDGSYIIEIGNFIYDGILLAKDFDKIVLMIGAAKLLKIAQGFKNTHNRFGSIDFEMVQSWCSLDIKRCVTVKGVRELLGDDVDAFDMLVKKKAKQQMQIWFKRDVEIFYLI